MKYFYDCEFLEGTQKTGFFRWKETAPTIDLISIGIVAEDGREYYAVSKEFNLKEAWNRYDIIPETDTNAKAHGIFERKNYWIRDNVLKPIHKQLAEIEGKNNLFHEHYDLLSYNSLKYLIIKHGKTRKQISEDMIKFCMPEYDFKECYTGRVHQINGYWVKDEHKSIDLYGYYSAYDHVALCWLFGKMMNLPKGFPMYTRDLKQMLDEALDKKTGKVEFFNRVDRFGPTGPDLSTMTLDEKLKLYKDQAGMYPAQENEHHALADARWNKNLYDFIQGL